MSTSTVKNRPLSDEERVRLLNGPPSQVSPPPPPPAEPALDQLGAALDNSADMLAFNLDRINRFLARAVGAEPAEEEHPRPVTGTAVGVLQDHAERIDRLITRLGNAADRLDALA